MMIDNDLFEIEYLVLIDLMMFAIEYQNLPVVVVVASMMLARIVDCNRERRKKIVNKSQMVNRLFCL